MIRVKIEITVFVSEASIKKPVAEYSATGQV